MGRMMDMLGIVSTTFGMATSLGLNGLQLSGGLNYLFGTPNKNLIAVMIVVSVTSLFLISATTGIEKGVAELADIGVGAMIALVPVLVVLRWRHREGGVAVLETIGNYIIQVIPMSLITGVGDEEWMASWTIFYWAWWYSWGPFVGMFVARISRGRTIREFMIGVIAAPTVSGSSGSPRSVGRRSTFRKPVGPICWARLRSRRSWRCSRRWTCCRCR